MLPVSTLVRRCEPESTIKYLLERHAELAAPIAVALIGNEESAPPSRQTKLVLRSGVRDGNKEIRGGEAVVKAITHAAESHIGHPLLNQSHPLLKKHARRHQHDDLPPVTQMLVRCGQANSRLARSRHGFDDTPEVVRLPLRERSLLPGEETRRLPAITADGVRHTLDIAATSHWVGLNRGGERLEPPTRARVGAVKEQIRARVELAVDGALVLTQTGTEFPCRQARLRRKRCSDARIKDFGRCHSAEPISRGSL